MALKIAIIGGGSAYAPGLIQAFIHQADVLTGAELALMDIATEELEIVSKLGQRMAAAAGIDLKITATRHQAEAIAGADFVLSTFRQGGFEARHLDEALPLEYNIIGQETIGPGGFFFAIRTLPAIRSILSDIEEYAPEATLVNYTNPTQIVAEAVTHFSTIPCISICDQTNADKSNILHALDKPDAVVSLESIGLNHATWSTTFTIDGEDGIEVMKRNYDRVMQREDIDNRVKRQFRLALAYDRLPNSYLQYYYFRDETVAEAQAAPQTRAEVILDSLPGYYRHFKEQIAADVPTLTHVRGGSIFGDMAVEVLTSLINKDGAIHTLNIPNRSALPDFAPDRVVEVPARVGAAGVTPLAQEHFPSEIVGLLKMLAEYQWLAAEAIWRDDHRALEWALASHPLVLSLSLAKKMLNHILPLQKLFMFKG
jgi:6-phospho-beta-glucosidase